jgi:hypothetical protein
LPEEWKESIIGLTFRKVHEILVIFEAYKTLFSIFLSRLTPYEEKITEIIGGGTSNYQVHY